MTHEPRGRMIIEIVLLAVAGRSDRAQLES